MHGPSLTNPPLDCLLPLRSDAFCVFAHQADEKELRENSDCFLQDLGDARALASQAHANFLFFSDNEVRSMHKASATTNMPWLVVRPKSSVSLC